MSENQSTRRITWRQPAVFAAATLVCTVLAIWAVVSAPVVSATVVSGLYIAAAVYVPLALWFGVWGCAAGYVSCIFMGLYLGYSLPFVLVWGLADFFEGFVPLLIYRSIKTKPALSLNRPKTTYTLNALLAVVLVGSAASLLLTYTAVFLGTLAAAVALLVVQASVEDRKTWITWLVVGVFAASIVSGVFGVGALAAFGTVAWADFQSVFVGWVLGDIIVLATLGTILTVTLTPYIMKSKIYVKRYFS
jgi:uncharacterized membrane protein